jgi:CubicO group peptidase (beta-lactamase class C family)
MKTTLWVALLSSASFILAAGCDGSTEDSDVPERFRPFVKAVEQDRVELGAPGIAVAVLEGGNVTFARGFGRKDASRPDPVQPTTLFRIGSCTKMMTAMAVLQLVQQGLVSLDEPITAHVPAFHLNKTPAAVADVKVRHLLSHSGGLFDYGETNAPADEQTDAALEQVLTGRFADIEYVASPPGALYAYANPDFMIAGLIAEKVLGVPYRTLMHDRVFAPLGMSRTFFLPSEVLADGDYAVGANCSTPGDARCYAPEMAAVVEPDTYDNPWGRPAGYAWSSVLDLAQIARLLVHGQTDVLDDDLRAAMTSAQISTKDAGDVISYGFGVMVTEGLGGGTALPYRALKTISHGGDIAGFSADIVCIPALDFCLISLANGTSAHLARGVLSALQTLITLPAPSTMPDVEPKPERYPLYAGSYNDQFGVGQVNVTAESGKLFIQIPSFDDANTPYEKELAPASLDNFAITVAGEQRQLTFLADANGTYTYIRSRPYVATRMNP